ncbi:hypothetical protein [Roseofilum casamattae]|uniref:Uncharacterized protein n=1 Tax=Roseofilum casamattae BLCC-M143 TaxID=3022442 RepID=A0ABT7BWM3_9CYAN|nr:hypothetical protein [Roseofilum casamattae]MDJ1183602.1 hypothetical protein [Roseofilum casamattae BLCC-M143]
MCPRRRQHKPQKFSSEQSSIYQFSTPEVIQSKGKNQTAKQLPQWQPGENRSISPLQRLQDSLAVQTQSTPNPSILAESLEVGLGELIGGGSRDASSVDTGSTVVQADLMSESAYKAKLKEAKTAGLPKSAYKAFKKASKKFKVYLSVPPTGKVLALQELKTALEEIKNKQIQEQSKVWFQWASTTQTNQSRIKGVYDWIVGHINDEIANIQQHFGDVLHDENDYDTQDTDKTSDYSNFDGMQFKISGRPPEVLVEVVQRKKGDYGLYEYAATGKVLNFSNHQPIIKYYDQPRSLGNWYPKVAHMNGMNIKPTTGLRDAMALQKEMNKTIDKCVDGASLNLDAVDLLWTYSASLGGYGDVMSGVNAQSEEHQQNAERGTSNTLSEEIQAELMIDAVRAGRVIEMSAHSRGTLYTDLAVRIAFARLRLNVNFIYHTPRQIINEMDKYINLTYAGNAIGKPSKLLPATYLVGSLDNIVYGAKAAKKQGWKSEKSGIKKVVENRIGAQGIGTQEELDSKAHPGSSLEVIEGAKHGYSDYKGRVGYLIGQSLIESDPTIASYIQDQVEAYELQQELLAKQEEAEAKKYEYAGSIPDAYSPDWAGTDEDDSAFWNSLKN